MLLFAVWLVLAGLTLLLARQNVAAPGLYYDEALFAGYAKDFLTADPRPHVEAPLVLGLLGRPLPILVQGYIGGVKSWMLIPSFAVFGANTAVLRITSLCWGLVGLLVFMLWARKLCGLGTALIAAPILAFDPSFFFLSVLDWGLFTPSFLCRVGGFLFLMRWAESKRWRDGILAAVFLGLGVLNKIDFVVILLGAGFALVLTYRHTLLAVVRGRWRQIALCGLISVLILSPMTLCLRDIFGLAGGTSSPGGDLTEKLNTTLAMYDGTYIYRLMRVGGRFDHMYDQACGFDSPFGVFVIFAAVLLATMTALRARRAKGLTSEGRLAAFLLLCLLFISLATVLLPRAVRMHHTTLVYPFPHLVIAFAAVCLWKTPSANFGVKFGLRSLAVALAGLTLVGHDVAVGRTQEYIAETGGRGLWSNSFEKFCDDIKGEENLAIVSLDWGFSEQLAFLTENNILTEPFWSGHVAVTKAGIYLMHAPGYAVYPQGLEILEYAQSHPERGFTIRAYRDSRHGDVAFYAIRYKPPPRN